MAKEPTQRDNALTAMRAAINVASTKAPGTPSVSLDLSKVMVFVGDDGETKAVIPMQEVLYLTDQVLRSHKP